MLLKLRYILRVYRKTAGFVISAVIMDRKTLFIRGFVYGKDGVVSGV